MYSMCIIMYNFEIKVHNSKDSVWLYSRLSPVGVTGFSAPDWGVAGGWAAVPNSSLKINNRMNYVKLWLYTPGALLFMVVSEMEGLDTKEQEPTLKWHQNTSVGEVERHEDSVSEIGSPTTHHSTGSRTFNIQIQVLV